MGLRLQKEPLGEVPTLTSIAGISKSGAVLLPEDLRMVVVLPTNSKGWRWKHASVGASLLGHRRF
jgi:hypothetical protein